MLIYRHERLLPCIAKMADRGGNGLASHSMKAGADRLAAKVQVDAGTGCWLWTGSLNRKGYPWLFIANRYVYAHRVTYEAVHGPMPTGAEIDHLCRTRRCVNPLHLDAVTHRENLVRGAAARFTGACPEGHPIERGKQCLACARDRSRVYYWRTKDLCACGAFKNRRARTCVTCRPRDELGRIAVAFDA